MNVHNIDRLLADIGNTHIHIYDGKKVLHLDIDEAIEHYRNKEIYYISVNSKINLQLEEKTLWKDISNEVHIIGEYDTMGVDRKAFCLSNDNGVFVDAGSAITVDIVENGIYKGGFIYPGIKAFLYSYRTISPALKIEFNNRIKLEEKLPTTTKEQISYTMILSLKLLIDKYSKNKIVYFTGGDGKFLSGYFDNSFYDEKLVFNGMINVLNISEKLKI